MSITAEFVRECLDYDCETGRFTWRIQRGRARAGDGTGYIASNRLGYRWVTVGLVGKNWPAHRLAWLHHYGEWPKGEIDHLNQDATDNRISNLRDTVRLLNSKNQHMRCTNTSGVTGVYWEERTKKWVAEVKVSGKKNRLGRFTDIVDAAQAVKDFRGCMGFTSLHGAVKKLQEA